MRSVISWSEERASTVKVYSDFWLPSFSEKRSSLSGHNVGVSYLEKLILSWLALFWIAWSVFPGWHIVFHRWEFVAISWEGKAPTADIPIVDTSIVAEIKNQLDWIAIPATKSFNMRSLTTQVSSLFLLENIVLKIEKTNRKASAKLAIFFIKFRQAQR